MTGSNKVTCDVCEKEFRNIKAHKRLAHPDGQGRGKSEGEIAEILYMDVVKPLCEERGISVLAWEEIEDRGDYLRVARKILGKEG